ncbi:putative lysine-specific demethylase 4B [Folsomia candida]|uniref:Putative lysine-specific demethylase 4B n=1 Tax=Folsomia candida TaxID=158441 RepID=A0A226CYU0_FOLCA|nr:putative lysine-specific demethylase 4B [Folsomia candida]
MAENMAEEDVDLMVVPPAPKRGMIRNVGMPILPINQPDRDASAAVKQVENGSVNLIRRNGTSSAIYTYDQNAKIPRRWRQFGPSPPDELRHVQYFYVTVQQLEDRLKLFYFLEYMGMEEAGAEVIVYPPGWIPDESWYLQRSAPTLDHVDEHDLEDKFFNSLPTGAPLYFKVIQENGKDPEWYKLTNIESLLMTGMPDGWEGGDGIGIPAGYLGTWKTSFGWHIEDSALKSVNFATVDWINHGKRNIECHLKNCPLGDHPYVPVQEAIREHQSEDDYRKYMSNSDRGTRPNESDADSTVCGIGIINRRSGAKKKKVESKKGLK